MNKIIKIPVFVIICIFLITCDDYVNPYSDFKEKYVLSCILNPEDSIQTLVLMKNIKPGVIITDTTINTLIVDNALINLWYQDKVVTFKQSKGKDRISEVQEGYYYSKDIEIIRGQSYYLEAVVNENKKLRASMIMPSLLEINYKGMSPQIPAKANEPGGNNNISISWFFNNIFNSSTVKCLLVYKNNETGVIFNKVIPHNYSIKGNNILPLFYRPQQTGDLLISLETFDIFINELKKEIKIVSNYSVLGVVLDFYVYDNNLMNYYNSVNAFKDKLSMVIDESDYSSITGGYGVFGGVLTARRSILITNDFITNYGFRITL